MTGVIFIKMFGVVMKCSKGSPLNLEDNSVKSCLNKLYLTRSDIPHFKTDADQDMPSRDHIFRIYEFPKVNIAFLTKYRNGRQKISSNHLKMYHRLL